MKRSRQVDLASKRERTDPQRQPLSTRISITAASAWELLSMSTSPFKWFTDRPDDATRNQKNSWGEDDSRFRKNARPAFVSVTTAVELLLIAAACWMVVSILPAFLNPEKIEKSSARGAVQIPILQVDLTAEGRELWVQRGVAEIASINLTTGQSEIVHASDAGAIRDWAISWDANTFLMLSTLNQIDIYRNDQLVVSEQPISKENALVAISENGKIAGRILDGRSFRCWDLSTEEPTSTEFLLHVYAGKMVFNSDGSQLFFSSPDGGIHLYDTRTGNLIRSIDEKVKSMRIPVISPDDQRLVVVCGPSVDLYDLQSGERVWTIEATSSVGLDHANFSRDGKWVAVSGFSDSILIVDALTGKTHRALPANPSVHRFVFSPGSDALYSGAVDGSMHSWSLSTGRPTHQFDLLEESRNTAKVSTASSNSMSHGG